jgi:hypothetical protein
MDTVCISETLEHQNFNREVQYTRAVAAACAEDERVQRKDFL